MIRRMIAWVCLPFFCSGLMTTAFVSSVLAQGSSPPSAMTKLKVAHTFVAGALAPIWTAGEGGYFRKYNLSVDFVRIGAIAAEAALIAGEVDVLATAPDEVLPAIAGGAPLVMFATQNNSPEYKLVVAPAIRGPEDLKGKRLAISRVGASSDWLTRNALRKLGLPPNSVKIIPVGGQGERASALQSGNVDATVVVPPAQLSLEKAGFHTLADLGEMGIPYVSVTLVTRRDFLKRHPKALEGLLKAYGEGMHRFKTDKAFGKKVIAKRMKLNNEEIIEATYDYYATDKVTQRVPYISLSALQYLLEQTAKTVPAAARLKPQDVEDMSLVERLDGSGFYKALYQ